MFAFFLQLFKFRLSKTSYHLLMPIHTTAVQHLQCGFFRTFSFELFTHTPFRTVESTLWNTQTHNGDCHRSVLGTHRHHKCHSLCAFQFTGLSLCCCARLARSVCIIHQMSILTFQSEIFRKNFCKLFSESFGNKIWVISFLFAWNSSDTNIKVTGSHVERLVEGFLQRVQPNVWI